MIKTIAVEIDSTHGVAKLLPGLVGTPAWNCNILHALKVTGILTTPVNNTGFSLAQFWPWLRYLPALEAAVPLKLKQEWDTLDSHQKTLLSDDFGIGLPSYYLAKNHGFTHFGDSVRVLETLLKGFASLAKIPKKKGPAKSPDFIALDVGQQFHILECKGSQDNPGALRDSIASGVAQKSNVTNCCSTLFASSMVGGVFVPQFKSPHPAKIVFADPEPDGWQILAQLDREEIAKAIRRDFFDRCLAFIGLEQAKTTVTGLDRHQQSDALNFRRSILTNAGFEERDGTFKKSFTRGLHTQDLGGRSMRVSAQVELSETLTRMIPLVFNRDSADFRRDLDEWLRLSSAAWRFEESSTGERSSSAVELPLGLRIDLSCEQA